MTGITEITGNRLYPGRYRYSANVVSNFLKVAWADDRPGRWKMNIRPLNFDLLAALEAVSAPDLRY